MNFLLNNFPIEDLQPLLEKLAREARRGDIAKRIAFMDDIMTAFAATQTKSGGQSYQRYRRDLVREVESLEESEKENQPKKLSHLFSTTRKLGDLVT